MSASYSFYRQRLHVTEEIMAAWTDLELFKSNVLSKLSTLNNSTISLKIVAGWNKYYFESGI